MSDHQPLHDAFAEYERRADAFSAGHAASTGSGRNSRGPVLLIAASVVLVLAVAGGVVWLAAGTGHPKQTGRPAAEAPGSTSSGTATPSSSAPVSGPAAPSTSAPQSVQILLPSPSSTGPRVNGTPRVTSPAETATPTHAAPPSPRSTVPQNAQQMEHAFRRVLGDTATFSVSQHQGNYLIGILTTSRTGAQGGFDIQASAGEPGDKAFCEDPGRGSHCTISTPAPGGSLAVERETTDGGKGVLYFVDYVFPDGSTYLMHLSNLSDPKGAGHRFGPKPPLTLGRMTTIIESPRWSDQ